MKRIIFKEDKCMKTLLANLLGLVIGFLSGVGLVVHLMTTDDGWAEKSKAFWRECIK